MTYYHVTVIRVDDNPAYDAQRAAASSEEERRRRQTGFMSTLEPYPVPRSLDTRALDVVLTEDEYEAMKRHIVEAWR